MNCLNGKIEYSGNDVTHCFQAGWRGAGAADRDGFENRCGPKPPT